jgi:hypothetical protein
LLPTNAYRDAAKGLAEALTALDAANHSVRGSASETRKARALLAELLRLADGGEPSSEFGQQASHVARRLDETALWLKRDLEKAGHS